MRFAPIFAAVLAFAGIASATPAAASVALTKSVPVAASINADPAVGTIADQYRDRRGWRSDRGWRGNRGNRGYYRRGYYRPNRYYRPYRNWRGGRMVCRYRYGYRRCYRAY